MIPVVTRAPKRWRRDGKVLDIAEAARQHRMDAAWPPYPCV
jgi:hypothetical protein